MLQRSALLTSRTVLAATAVAATLLAAGCTQPDPDAPTQMYFDPYEDTNRHTHELNKALDTAFLRPAGVTYVTIVPEPVGEMVSNFGENLKTPGEVVNNILQGRLDDALTNSFRFALNSTVGIGGLIDAATLWGVSDPKTDFGETLYIWGVPEGAFVTLPGLGPSTERDAVGKVVDILFDPIGIVIGGSEQYIGTVARAASTVGDRGQYLDTVDSVLYDSADSYAQMRSLYLQQRRYELSKLKSSAGSAAAADPYDDPYSDPYGEPEAESYDDPYATSYEDPYDIQ